MLCHSPPPFPCLPCPLAFFAAMFPNGSEQERVAERRIHWSLRLACPPQPLPGHLPALPCKFVVDKLNHSIQKHLNGREILNMMYKELMILGIVAFLLFAIEIWGETEVDLKVPAHAAAQLACPSLRATPHRSC